MFNFLMFNVMSKSTDIKEAAEAVFDVKRPLVVAEKKPAVGKGGAAFKSLTAAVRAAEREREVAVRAKVACDAVLDACCARLREMEDYVACVRRCMIWDAVVSLLAVAALGICVFVF